jgi:tetratricopeptide (TPR) repeat protein
VISYDELKRKDQGAAKLLQLWGCLDNQDLRFQLLRWPIYQAQAPEWLRQITATEFSFWETVGTLLSFSLIEQKGSSDSYSMHAVVHDWIREFINKEEGDDLFRTAITCVGLAVPGDNEKDYSVVQYRLLPHASRLSQHLQINHIFAKRSNKIDDTFYLYALHNLGLLYSGQGKLAEAEIMYQRALAGIEKALGPEHASTLSTVNNLYRDQGKLAEAEVMYQRALTVQSQ